MPAGLIIRNAAGVVTLDTTDSAGRILGTIMHQSGGVTSVTPTKPAGTLFCLPLMVGGFLGIGLGNLEPYPTITVTSTTVSWTNGYEDTPLLYGVY